MDAPSFYRLSAPEWWASCPEQWSFSSLRAFERCPRCWQLANSSYGDELPRFPRRPNPHTAAGSIAHEMLDRLFRALALRGLPAVGSPAFRETLASVDLLGSIRRALDEYEDDLRKHPRGAGLRLRISERDISNQVCRLFHAEYARAQDNRAGAGIQTGAGAAGQARVPVDRWLALLTERKVLTEVPLEHPNLPLRGVIDLVAWHDGTTRLLDFKTGAPKPEHREQLELYALLWFRCTGDVPVALEVRYPGECVRYPVDRSALEHLEDALRGRIHVAVATLADRPAKAVVGAHCRGCDVRQFCDDYWSAQPPIAIERGKVQLRSGWLDVELTVVGEVSAHGFSAKTRDGTQVAVVFDADGLALHGPFVADEWIRVLGAGAGEPDGLRLLRSTEVFHRTE